jgi:hypothetical protein
MGHPGNSRHFCTLFDRNYAGRGLALYRSLEQNCGDFRLVILCLDDETSAALSALRLGKADLVTIDTLEQWDPELRRVRPERTRAEYYFTCKPALALWALERHPGARRITYLDSDLYYFADPGEIDQEIAGSSVALSPHRFAPHLSERVQYGQFNAGWVSASADDEGRAFLDWWRARCIEWCKFAVEGSRFADQKYLDQVPKLFPRAVAVAHPGLNAAQWNLAGLNLTVTDGRAQLNGKPLVCFHFHGVKQVLGRLHDSGLLGYGLRLTPLLRDLIFRPYLAALAQAEAQLRERAGLSLTAPKRDGYAEELRDFGRRFRLGYQLVRSGTGVLMPQDSRE